MPNASFLNAEMLSVPTWIIRGGTSKGVYLLESDLPSDRTLWGPYLIEMFAARDARQMDGIGEERVYWDFNCGNLTPSVGTFAMLAGLVEPTPGTTAVRIYQTNTKMMLSVEVPTGPDGSPLVTGDYEI